MTLPRPQTGQRRDFRGPNQLHPLKALTYELACHPPTRTHDRRSDSTTERDSPGWGCTHSHRCEDAGKT
jgi:hypothetical protein